MKQYLDPLQQEAHEAFFIIGRDGPPEVLPPGATRQQFISVLSELRQAVGNEHVVVGNDLVSFVDPFAVNEDHIPSAAAW
jgi:hypothetical protein